MKHADYWNSIEGYRAIQNPNVWPEGFDVRDELSSWHGNGTIVELGCGKGRLCSAFRAEDYLGLDPCQLAIDHARACYVEYSFDLYHKRPVMANTCLMYTLLSMVPDDELGPLLDTVHSQTVIIGDVCGRDWRRGGKPPVYNREWVEYEEAMRDRGYVQMSYWTKQHEGYRDWDRADTRVHFGVFRGGA